jgi:hypothetical protein
MIFLLMVSSAKLVVEAGAYLENSRKDAIGKMLL